MKETIIIVILVVLFIDNMRLRCNINKFINCLNDKFDLSMTNKESFKETIKQFMHWCMALPEDEDDWYDDDLYDEYEDDYNIDTSFKNRPMVEHYGEVKSKKKSNTVINISDYKSAVEKKDAEMAVEERRAKALYENNKFKDIHDFIDYLTPTNLKIYDLWMNSIREISTLEPSIAHPETVIISFTDGGQSLFSTGRFTKISYIMEGN